MNKAIDHSL